MFKDNFKKYRLAAGFTQLELAEMLKTTTITISRYETGQRQPNIETLKKLAIILNVSIDDLVKDSPELIQTSLFD